MGIFISVKLKNVEYGLVCKSFVWALCMLKCVEWESIL